MGRWTVCYVDCFLNSRYCFCVRWSSSSSWTDCHSVRCTMPWIASKKTPSSSLTLALSPPSPGAPTGIYSTKYDQTDLWLWRLISEISFTSKVAINILFWLWFPPLSGIVSQSIDSVGTPGYITAFKWWEKCKIHRNGVKENAISLYTHGRVFRVAV